MELDDFLKRERVLSTMEPRDLINAGIHSLSDDRNWVWFCERPFNWLRAQDRET